MYLIRDVLLALSLLTCFWQAHGADKYTDENRPYEFGFNIEGEQHRHEKKGNLTFMKVLKQRNRNHNFLILKLIIQIRFLFSLNTCSSRTTYWLFFIVLKFFRAKS